MAFRVVQDVNSRDFLLLSTIEEQHRSNKETATFVTEQGTHNLIIHVCRLYGGHVSSVDIAIS